MSKNSIVEMDLDKLTQHPINIQIYTEKRPIEDKELEKSISEMGLLEPIVINNDNTIVSGHRRFFACKKLGIKKIRCRYSSSTNEVMELIELNKYRKKTKKETDAEWKILIDERKKSVSAGNPNKMKEDKTSSITKRELHSSTFQVSQSTSAKMMFVEKHEPKIYERVLDGLISVDGAYRETQQLHPNVGKGSGKKSKTKPQDIFQRRDMLALGVKEMKGKRGQHTHPKTSFKEEFDYLWRKYFKGKGGLPIEDFIDVFKKSYPIQYIKYLKEEYHD